MSNSSLNIADSKTQNSNPSSDTLIEQFHVENTPFIIVKADDKFFVALGRYRITNMLNSKEEAEYLIDNKDWNMLASVISVLSQAIINESKIK